MAWLTFSAFASLPYSSFSLLGGTTASLTSLTLPFVGGGAEENDYFGYIFGAKNYEQNGSYVPASLREVSVTVGAVPEHAFYGCSSLDEIVLPASLTSIGFGAFQGCSGLDSAVFENASGWKTSSGTEIPQSDLSDASLAVKCLTETYCYEYWRCEV